MAVCVIYFMLVLVLCEVKCETNNVKYDIVNGNSNNITTNHNLNKELNRNKTKTSAANAVNKTAVAATCANNFTESNGKTKIDYIKEYCHNKHCIAKCCNEFKVFYYDADAIVKKIACLTPEHISLTTNMTIDIKYSLINIYENDIENKVQKTELTLANFTFIKNKKLLNSKCSNGIQQEPMKNYYILRNNSLIRENPNFYKRFVHNWDMGEFCVEHLVIKSGGHLQEPFLMYKYTTTPVNKTKNVDKNTEDIAKAVAMLISCFFLLLVLFVYGVIRELQNLHGMVLMGYVGTLAITFFFKAVELLGVYTGAINSQICKPLSVFVYFTTISCFFWMNVMSLDIWWTFRGIFKCRRIHRRGELVKFGWYALYSWGTPLLVTIAVGVIDYTDLAHLPHIFKPHFEYCFYLKNGMTEMRYFLYIPIFVLLVGDWIFFLMTAFNIWRIRRCMAKFANEASKYNKNQNRFGLYLKLSLVMGVSWVLEVVDLPWWLETLAMAYNTLLGVAIFFIFVFKRKVLFQLCKRFSIKNRFLDDLQRQYSKSTASASDRKRSDVETTSTGYVGAAEIKVVA